MVSDFEWLGVGWIWEAGSPKDDANFDLAQRKELDRFAGSIQSSMAIEDAYSVVDMLSAGPADKPISFELAPGSLRLRIFECCEYERILRSSGQRRIFLRVKDFSRQRWESTYVKDVRVCNRNSEKRTEWNWFWTISIKAPSETPFVDNFGAFYLYCIGMLSTYMYLCGSGQNIFSLHLSINYWPKRKRVKKGSKSKRKLRK